MSTASATSSSSTSSAAAVDPRPALTAAAAAAPPMAAPAASSASSAPPAAAVSGTEAKQGGSDASLGFAFVPLRLLPGHPEVHCMPHYETGTCTYVVWCRDTREAVIVDPVLDYNPADQKSSTVHADAVLDYVRDHKLTPRYLLETHAHADHLSGSAYLHNKLSSILSIGRGITQVQEIFGEKFHIDEKELPRDGSQFDLLLADGSTFKFGNIECMAVWTPGHTPACMTLILGDAAFVGDTLFAPDVGTARCDFPGGGVRALYHSIQRLYSLPDSTVLYLCHDYPPAAPASAPAGTQPRAFRWQTTVAEQKAHNIMCSQAVSEEAFVAVRSARDAKLSMPRLLVPSIDNNIRGTHPKPEHRH